MFVGRDQLKDFIIHCKKMHKFSYKQQQYILIDNSRWTYSMRNALAKGGLTHDRWQNFRLDHLVQIETNFRRYFKLYIQKGK